MGFRFRRSMKLIPGVRLNFGKRGVSVSMGPRGAKLTVGPTGTRATVGLPGTGLSYTERIGGEHVVDHEAVAVPTQVSSVSLGWIVAAILAVVILFLIF